MGTASARHSENFKPEYDPDTLDEDNLPLFDFGGRDLLQVYRMSKTKTRPGFRRTLTSATQPF